MSVAAGVSDLDSQPSTLHLILFILQSAEEFAKGFVESIEKLEHSLHKKLEASFVDLSENAFKAHRRKLPINQL